MDSKSLKRTSPEALGIKSSRILKLIKDLDNIGNEVHGFMVARKGCVAAESWMAPYAADIPHSCHSLGKSYTCTAALIAMTEGLLSPDDLITDIFRDEIEAFQITPHPDMKKVTVRHIMTMSSGTKGMPALNDMWLRNFLASPMQFEPGSTFMYNTTGSCVLGAVVEKVTGKGLLEYMKEKLFCRIGIGDSDIIWQKFANGMYAEPGICATTEANLKLGLFYMAGGFADGEQIIDKKLMKQAVSQQISTESWPDPVGRYGYGYQLWMGSLPGTYRFDGGQGQLCVCCPAKDIAVAIHQAGRDPGGTGKCLELIHEFMADSEAVAPSSLPGAFEEDAEALAELRDYLAGRHIYVPKPSEETQKAIKLQAEKLAGVYHVVPGDRVQPWIEVVPLDYDFWRYFYDPSFAVHLKTIEIRPEEGAVRVVFNGRSAVLARFDGKTEVCTTPSPLPGLDKTCSFAGLDIDGDLRIYIRWLNGWFRCTIMITPLGDGAIGIRTEKDMLHEGGQTWTGAAKAVIINR